MRRLKNLGILGFITLLSLVMVACGSASNSSDKEEKSAGKETEETPKDQLVDLAIGSSVTINEVTITVNSVEDGPEASGSPTYEVNVTYENNSDKSMNASPYDWTTVLNTGSDKAHVGGKSFHTTSIAKGKEWTGVVTLWKGQAPEKIKFESSFLNVGGEDHQVTWVVNDEE
ncbi:hypothetical protein [Isobaculum melis]|uniref:DUF4352 domain-containing protein n=1 Tax=Isobaculum melis TaxID=142588 RepID=A0A1H9SHC3_9LACT|nr:hypothetical protein [Isobaculum melis]SER84456.1 protein of unknown function [Isobaculum melis]